MATGTKAAAAKPAAQTAQAANSKLPEIPRELRAAHSPASVADELSVEYVKPAALAEMGRFNIVSAYVRSGQFGDECCFEVQLLDGDNQGATGTVTMKDTPVRRKMVDVIKKHGSVGPYLLRPVGKENKGNQPWGFVAADDPNAAPF